MLDDWEFTVNVGFLFLKRHNFIVKYINAQQFSV